MTKGMKGIRTIRRIALAVVGVVVLAASAHAAMHLVMGGHATKPAASEFGFGPRHSASGLYAGNPERADAAPVRRLQTIRVEVARLHGAPDRRCLDLASAAACRSTVTVLPTQPRVTARLGHGVYVVDGPQVQHGRLVGAEASLSSKRAMGPDSVIFNLDL